VKIDSRSSRGNTSAIELVDDDALYEGEVLGDGAELAALSQTERLVESALEHVVALLHDSILVPLAGLDARRLEPIVVDDVGEALRERASASQRELVGRR
jgi:hypothetical protein